LQFLIGVTIVKTSESINWRGVIMARFGRAGQFLNNFADAYNVTNGIMRDHALSKASDVKPEEIAQYTPGQAQQLEAAANAKDDQGNALYNVQANEGGTYSVTPTAGGETGALALAPAKQYKLGAEVQDTPFTDDQIQQQRLRNMSTVAANFGDPVKATHYAALATEHQKAADQEDIRRTLASAQTQPGLQRGSYLDAISPQITGAYLRQGKVAEAKAWRDFAESEQGRVYADDFAHAQRLVAGGAYDDAMPVLQRIYNRDLPDGSNAKLTNLGGGRWNLDVIDERTGQVTGTKVMGAADLAKSAVNMLQPTKMVDFMVQQQGKREGEGALLDRQIQLEQMRQEGQESREDRRDDRFNKRLDAQSEMLDRRLSAGGKVTMSQDRSNMEIDAAREAITGMSPQEIMRRTAKATNTGRENPDYSPGLARQAALANRRKIGADDWFDTRQGQNQGDSFGSFSGKPLTELTEQQLQHYGKVAGPDGKAKLDAELTRRAFMGDLTMNGHKLGELTPKGYKVFDPQGRHIGYFGRQ